MESKLTKSPLPAIYVALMPMLKEIARLHGYALAAHGSMERDLDLIAIPWKEDALPEVELVEAIRVSIGGHRPGTDIKYKRETPEKKPHGRLAWSFYFDEKRARIEEGPYIDISVMPRLYLVKDAPK